ncbi:hypothetical protein Taro_018624 [Colocasia esculenta]|uniref:DUF4218 domain-containing protein n=1 Tax=Colocasia esculenta TaxID=4460 RepID=A0A843UZN7_COLES|nr:hypothetical protein [Colocasia esculenta]
MKVRNKAQVEGSITQAYLIEEISNFCSMYFDTEIRTRCTQPPRNDDGGDSNVEQGFITDSRVQEISYGPSKIVREYPGYIVNGYRFHTRDYRLNKSTMNSGVCVKGSAYNENEIDYYGIFEEVIELQFLGQDNNVFLFKCHWFDPTSIRHDTTYGIVDVKHKSKLSTYEPFILAAQAQQVYYSNYSSLKLRDWWAACRVKSRLFHEYELLPADDELEGVDDNFFQSDRSDARELAASTQFTEEVDPNALEQEVESDVEEESRHDEDEVEDDDEDDAELNIYGTWRTESDSFHVRWPRVRIPVHDKDCLPVHAGRPGDRTASPPTTRVVPPFPSSSPPEVESQHLAVEEGPQLPGRQPCWISGGKIDPGSASRYITTLVHAHIPGPVDAWREFPVPVRDLFFDMFTRRFAFTRPEDLPRARTVWESTAQTNLRKSMWEARDKAMKTTCNWDPMAWLDYGPVWLRRDY